MQRESAIKKLIKGLGFMLFGNILSGIMLISVAPVIGIWFFSLVALLFTMIIYFSLMFTAGFNDGRRERGLIKNRRVEEPKKNGWILYGLIPGALICVPVFIVMLGMLGQIDIYGEYMFAFRFLCGAIEPLRFVGSFQSVALTEYPLWFPIAGMAIYLIGSPAAAAAGFRFGFADKPAGSYMYTNERKD